MSVKQRTTETSNLVSAEKNEKTFPDKIPEPGYKMEIDWYYTPLIIVFHIMLVTCFTIPEKPLYTFVYVYFASLIGLFGVNVSAHRLFTHKTFKANVPLRILLIQFQTCCLQRSLLHWVRHHRAHHKYMDTNADPHNASRGLFYSHCGWLMTKPHPDVAKYGATIDVSDLEKDPYVMFQHNYYVPLAAITVIVTSLIPYLCWGESLSASFFIGFLWQYAISMHVTWSVNSIAHHFGSRPYDVNLSATDSNILSFFATGEGFHNYHHAFPWDYKSAELGNYSLNFSTAFIDFMAKIGWATEMKTASADMVRKRMTRTGVFNNNSEEVEQVWGWDDPRMTEEDKKLATVLNKTILNN